ncbi:MAG: PD-(D/E)XK nuclease domain-containing protein [Clostridiales bacterium]|nr:PD-(D/E)XK nuclease domain-containing protein [Clostridiales bacterium]
MVSYRQNRLVILCGLRGDEWCGKGENANGYYDIAIEIEDEEIGIVIEVKYAENARFEQECIKAIKQINDNDYTAELKNDGMCILWKYGVACYKSQCKVVVEGEEYDPDGPEYREMLRFE